MKAIVARDVHRSFGDTEVIHGLDFEIDEGSIFGFIGPSGSGKTTTIRMLTGVHPPSSGDLTVLGRAPRSYKAKDRSRIGYLPQLSVLFPSLTLKQNLAFVASVYGMGWPRGKRLRDSLEFVELWDDRGKRLRDSSGGMQRRLALAASLVHQPEIMFLDEPTVGIDPVLRRKFWDQFTALRDEGRTLFVTTQYVSEAAYCDVVGVISEGRMIALDTPEGLRRQAFGGEVIEIRAPQPVDRPMLKELSELEVVRSCERINEEGRLIRVTTGMAQEAIPRIGDWFDDRGQPLESIRTEQPSFDDVFVALVERSRA